MIILIGQGIRLTCPNTVFHEHLEAEDGFATLHFYPSSCLAELQVCMNSLHYMSKSSCFLAFTLIFFFFQRYAVFCLQGRPTRTEVLPFHLFEIYGVARALVVYFPLFAPPLFPSSSRHLIEHLAKFIHAMCGM